MRNCRGSLYSKSKVHGYHNICANQATNYKQLIEYMHKTIVLDCCKSTIHKVAVAVVVNQYHLRCLSPLV